MTSQGTIIPRVLFCFALALAIAGCDGVSDPQPQSGFAPEEAVSSIEGLEAATTGNYNRLISGGYYHYSRHLFYMTEFAGDNVSLSGSTTDPLFGSYTLGHTVDQFNAENFWNLSYEIIHGTSRVID